MSRKPYLLSKQLVVAVALALGASGVALADGSSMSRFGGESYAYFNQPVARTPAASPAWRQNHANGLTESELQALSSSSLATSAFQVDYPVVASAPADPAWRQSHPSGLTERELIARSSATLSVWQDPFGRGVVADYGNVAETATKETIAARLANFFRR